MVHQTTLDTLDRLIRWSFYALIFLLPVGIGFVSSFAAFAVTFFWIKRACVIVMKRPKGMQLVKSMFFPADSFLCKPMLFFVLASGVSVIFSQNHDLSISGFFGKLMRGVLLYASFLEGFKTVSQLSTFVNYWIVSSFVIALSGLSQYFLGHDFIRQLPMSDGRVAATMRQANDFGAYIISICPTIMALLIHWDSIAVEISSFFKRPKVRSIAIALFFFMAYVALVICLGFTFSRAAWVAFFVAVIFLGICKKEALPFTFLMIVGFMWIFTPFMVSARDVSLITDNVKHIGIPADGKPLPKEKNVIKYVQTHLGSGRWAFWNEAIHIIHDYPWWGSGINTYSQMGVKYKFNWGGYPHNSYLQMTAELGLLGIGTFLVMIGTLFVKGISSIRVCPSGYLRALLIGVMASLTAYLFQSFFDTTFYSVQLSVLMWIMMATVVAIMRMNQLTKAST